SNGGRGHRLAEREICQPHLRLLRRDLTPRSWNEDGNELTFRLRRGVKWHDGQPFTANDVKCTWDLLLGNSQEKLRANPRKAWYARVALRMARRDLQQAQLPQKSRLNSRPGPTRSLTNRNATDWGAAHHVALVRPGPRDDVRAAIYRRAT